jgi:hypothetical protein
LEPLSSREQSGLVVVFPSGETISNCSVRGLPDVDPAEQWHERL